MYLITNIIHIFINIVKYIILKSITFLCYYYFYLISITNILHIKYHDLHVGFQV